MTDRTSDDLEDLESVADNLEHGSNLEDLHTRNVVTRRRD